MTAVQAAPPGTPKVGEQELEHFLRRGYLVLPHVASPDVHETIRRAAGEIYARGPGAAVQLGDAIYPAIPELREVLEASPVQQALKLILGEGAMLHEHRHLHFSSLREQQWHKDSYWGFRKLRHHRPRWCMMLYYPQDTTLEMGPTHVLAGSQYWSKDCEGTEHGEDILVPQDGTVSMFVEGSSAERSTRLRQAEGSLVHQHRPLVEPVALTVPAGSCVLMHYDLFHRAGFRSDERAPLRCMFKFQFLRTTEPAPAMMDKVPRPVAAVALAAAPAAAELEPVLQDIRSWLRGGWLRETQDAQVACASTYIVRACEVDRLADAYRLGRDGVASLPVLLRKFLSSEADARCAAYGLAAIGPQVEDSMVPFLQNESPRLRVWSAFVLGEAARPSPVLLHRFALALRAERVRAVEAAMLQALGCLASKARALEDRDVCNRCVQLALPFVVPMQRCLSLSGQNACLVLLMAGGLNGDLSAEALRALELVRNSSSDWYMAGFAHEALRRQEAAAWAANAQKEASIPMSVDEKFSSSLMAPTVDATTMSG